MIHVLKQGTSREKVDDICKRLSDGYDVQTSPIFGSGITIIGLVGDTSAIELEAVEMHEAVERAMKVQEPYKRANRKFHPDDTLIKVGGVEIGGNKICIAAGPCSVESEDQIKMVADMVRDSGAALLRGGAFKL